MRLTARLVSRLTMSASLWYRYVFAGRAFDRV